MRSVWLSGVLLCMVMQGCQPHEIIRKHPWQSWGNEETFLLSAERESFWQFQEAYVPLKPKAWPQLTQLLESNDFIPVSEEWVKEFATREIPAGADPWYLVRGLSYNPVGSWYDIYYFPESGILYVYTATMTGELFPVFDITLRAAPVAVRLPSPPRRVLCAAQAGGDGTGGFMIRDPDELPQIQLRSKK